MGLSENSKEWRDYQLMTATSVAQVPRQTPEGRNNLANDDGLIREPVASKVGFARMLV